MCICNKNDYEILKNDNLPINDKSLEGLMFYKYRGISKLEYILNIFLNNKMYAAKYDQLNDPMEGYYHYETSKTISGIIEAIKSGKDKIKICSLSKKDNEPLMWAHYADGHKGIVIGVKIKNEYDIRLIKYEGLETIDANQIDNFRETAIKVLSHKNKIWEYENEVRVFTEKEDFIKVDIIKVIFGSKMKKEKKTFLKNIIRKINEKIEFSEETNST